MKGTRRILYLLVLLLVLATFLSVRREALIAGTTSTVDAIIVAATLALVLLPAFKKVTVGGVTLEPEVQALIQREVGKAQGEALRISAKQSLRMIPLWERQHSSVDSANASATRLAMLEQHVSELERLWKESAREERIPIGQALRDDYWRLLSAGREHWASSGNYQRIKERVEAGLTALIDQA